MNNITYIYTLVILSLVTPAEGAQSEQKKFSIHNQSAGTIFVFTKHTYRLIRPSETRSVRHKKRLHLEYQSNKEVTRITLSDEQKKKLACGGRLLIRGKGDVCVDAHNTA